MVRSSFRILHWTPQLTYLTMDDTAARLLCLVLKEPRSIYNALALVSSRETKLPHLDFTYLSVFTELGSCETIASFTLACSTLPCSTLPCSTLTCATFACSTFACLMAVCLQLSGMMTDTAKRVVESTNVPQALTLLKGRVEITEERLANMADKSFRSLEDELVGLRAEVSGRGASTTADRQGPRSQQLQLDAQHFPHGFQLVALFPLQQVSYLNSK